MTTTSIPAELTALNLPTDELKGWIERYNAIVTRLQEDPEGLSRSAGEARGLFEALHSGTKGIDATRSVMRGKLYTPLLIYKTDYDAFLNGQRVAAPELPPLFELPKEVEVAAPAAAFAKNNPPAVPDDIRRVMEQHPQNLAEFVRLYNFAVEFIPTAPARPDANNAKSATSARIQYVLESSQFGDMQYSMAGLSERHPLKIAVVKLWDYVHARARDENPPRPKPLSFDALAGQDFDGLRHAAAPAAAPGETPRQQFVRLYNEVADIINTAHNAGNMGLYNSYAPKIDAALKQLDEIRVENGQVVAELGAKHPLKQAYMRLDEWNKYMQNPSRGVPNSSLNLITEVQLSHWAGERDAAPQPVRYSAEIIPNSPEATQQFMIDFNTVVDALNGVRTRSKQWHQVQQRVNEAIDRMERTVLPDGNLLGNLEDSNPLHQKYHALAGWRFYLAQQAGGNKAEPMPDADVPSQISAHNIKIWCTHQDMVYIQPPSGPSGSGHGFSHRYLESLGEEAIDERENARRPSARGVFKQNDSVLAQRNQPASLPAQQAPATLLNEAGRGELQSQLYNGMVLALEGAMTDGQHPTQGVLNVEVKRAGGQPTGTKKNGLEQFRPKFDIVTVTLGASATEADKQAFAAVMGKLGSQATTSFTTQEPKLDKAQHSSGKTFKANTVAALLNGLNRALPDGKKLLAAHFEDAQFVEARAGGQGAGAVGYGGGKR
jgi:hypothetical protein